MSATRSPGTGRLWMLVLASPVIWLVHFGVLYLVAEATCGPGIAPSVGLLGEATMRALAVGATIAAALGCLVVAALGRRRMNRLEGDGRDLGLAAWLLGIGASLVVLAVGIPAVVLETC